MKTIKGITAVLLTVLLPLHSCMEQEEAPSPDQPAGQLTSVTFVARTAPGTRSSLNPSGSTIKTLWVAAYRDGILQASASGNSPSMELTTGCTYNLYAVANLNGFTPPMRESDCRSFTSSPLGSLKELEGGFPMVWQRKGWTPAPHSGNQKVDVALERKVCRISLSMDRGTLKGLKVTSIHLKNSPASLAPFMEGGSRMVPGSAAVDGDRASAADLERFNAGGAITLYTLENCQGRLLPGNTDPWAKVPDSIPGKAGLCTWIEVRGTFDSGNFYSGSVIYRIFPGRDNCTDFTLEGNRNLDITLFLTGPGLDEVSWKVESDVTVDPTSATAEILAGHSADDLYIGETFRCKVTLSDDLLSHFGGDASGTSLEFETADGAAMELGRPVPDPSDPHVLLSDGWCTMDGNGSIFLKSRDGTRRLEVCPGITIKEPFLSWSEEPRIQDTERLEDHRPSFTPDLTINGGEKELHLYFTDSWGYNLNCGGSDYRLDLFDFTTDTPADPYAVGRTLRQTLTPGSSGDSGPAASMRVSCRNDGTDGNVNRNLCRGAADDRGGISPAVRETRYDLASSHPFTLSVQPVHVTIVDNGWSGHFETTNSVKVKNPSKVEMYVDFSQVMTTHSPSWVFPPTQSVINGVLSQVSLDEVGYITGGFNGIPPAGTQHYNHKMPAFAMKADRIVSNPAEGFGTRKVTDGEYTVHPAERLSAALLDRGISAGTSTTGQGLTNYGLYNLIDISFPYMDSRRQTVSAEDRLSDGSMTWETIYGAQEGYNDKGIWLHAGGVPVSQANGDLTPYGLDAEELGRLEGGYQFITLTYNKTRGQLMATANRSNGIAYDFKIKVLCNGHCQHRPNGSKEENHYPTATVEKSVSGVTLGSVPTAIDGGAMREAMDKIYNTTYTTKNTIFGKKWQKNSDPTDMTVVIQAKLSSTARQKTAKVWFNLGNIQEVSYHHGQRNKDLKVAVNPVTRNWKIYFVTPK